MSSIRDIRNRINNMKIKNTIIGGYDREDVYVKMNELVDLFSNCMKEEALKHEEEIMALNGKLEEITLQYSNSLRSLSGEFTRVIDNIALLQQNVIEMEAIASCETNTVEETLIEEEVVEECQMKETTEECPMEETTEKCPMEEVEEKELVEEIPRVEEHEEEDLFVDDEFWGDKKTTDEWFQIEKDFDI